MLSILFGRPQLRAEYGIKQFIVEAQCRRGWLRRKFDRLIPPKAHVAIKFRTVFPCLECHLGIVSDIQGLFGGAVKFSPMYIGGGFGEFDERKWWIEFDVKDSTGQDPLLGDDFIEIIDIVEARIGYCAAGVHYDLAV
jgi:hypothetical protein